jgi:hypothetical protein
MNNPTLTAGYSATETDDLMPVWLAQANAFDSPTDMRAIAATIEPNRPGNLRPSGRSQAAIVNSAALL